MLISLPFAAPDSMSAPAQRKSYFLRIKENPAYAQKAVRGPVRGP